MSNAAALANTATSTSVLYIIKTAPVVNGHEDQCLLHGIGRAKGGGYVNISANFYPRRPAKPNTCAADSSWP